MVFISAVNIAISLSRTARQNLLPPTDKITATGMDILHLYIPVYCIQMKFVETLTQVT